MSRVVLCAGALWVLGAVGCHVNVGSNGNQGESRRVVLRDGEDEVTLQAGAMGVALSVRSGQDEVTLHAKGVGAHVHVDDRDHTVSLRARIQGAVLSARSGADRVQLKAGDVKAAVRVRSAPAGTPRPAP